MKKWTTIFCVFITFISYCQNEISNLDIFEKISTEMRNYKIDTSDVPNDKLSKKIRELRTLRGGFNINEAIQFKLSEERSKTDANTQELDKIQLYFSSGNGKKWLDNAIIWIYRKQFTYNEIKYLIRFYKTDAGQKMASQFPVIMLQSLKSAEEITEYLKHKI